MKYQQPYGITDVNAPYINGNPVAGIQGSIPPAGAFEENQRELVNFIMLSGITPSGGDRIAGGDLYQVSKAAQSQKVNFAIDTGTQNAMRIALSPPVTAYTPGLIVRAQVLFSSLNDVSHTTLTLDAGAGPANVVKNDGSMPATNDLRSGGVYEFVSDSAGRWQLANFGGAGGGGSSTTVNVKIPYVRDTGLSANHLRAIFSPAITSVAEGDFIAVRLAFSLTSGAADITINSLATQPIKHPDGSNMTAGDAVANQVLLMSWDGAAWQIIGVIGTPSVIRPRIMASPPWPGGQYVAPATLTQVTNLSEIIQNTLTTSTFSSGVLTVGAGEDGLWHFDGVVSIGNQPMPQAIQLVFKRTRASVLDQMFAHGYSTYSATYMAEVTAYSSGWVELLAGDQVSLWVSPWASGGPFQLLHSGAPTNPGGTAQAYPYFSAALVSRHLI